MSGARWLALVVVLALSAMLGIALGSVSIPPADLWLALQGRGDPSIVGIVQGLRLPRVALAALVGGGLGMSGAGLQGVLRNPLAEPYLLGVSGGAAVGAVGAATLGIASPAVTPLAALAGAVLAVLVVIIVASVAGGRADPGVLVTAGVVVGAFANAVVMALISGAPANEARGALWWMMGSAADANWRQVAWLGTYAAIGGLLLIMLGREIDALSLGEEAAASLGVNVDRAAARVFVLASLLSAATVAAAGLVGFVGLVVPHIARGLGLHRHAPIMLASLLIGASLTVLADLAARTVHAPYELPLGAVTALIGVPFFLVQLARRAR